MVKLIEQMLSEDELIYEAKATKTKSEFYQYCVNLYFVSVVYRLPISERKRVDEWRKNSRMQMQISNMRRFTREGF